MKILIDTPLITIPAGVANHYLGLRNFFSKEVTYNQYIPNSFIQLKIRNAFIGKIFRAFLFVFDIIKLFFLIIKLKKPVILLNPSLGYSALFRDSIKLRIGKFFNCKIVVFIHGWDVEYFKKVNRKKFYNTWKFVDGFIVLASQFKLQLQDLGINSPILVTTTKVDDKIFSFSNTIAKQSMKNLLFLARIEKAKGLSITIQALTILQKKYPYLNLRVVGSGTYLEEAIQEVKKNNVNNVYFTGALFGENLLAEYKKADVYILPTSHGEGMPTTILEAMAFGLPVISRPVGGIVDFFENDKMGFLIESLDPHDFASKIEVLLNDKNRINFISEYNKSFAYTNFRASKVAQQLEKFLHEISS